MGSNESSFLHIKKILGKDRWFLFHYYRQPNINFFSKLKNRG